jgi:chromosome segregation ATPase
MARVEEASRGLRERLRAAEADRDARAAEVADGEERLAEARAELEALREEARTMRRDRHSASETASASQQRLGAAEEDNARLRTELRTVRQALAQAQRQGEEAQTMLKNALADLEAAERAQADAEAAAGSARASEAEAVRVVRVFEEQGKDLRAQLAAVQASAGAREDALRRELADLAHRLQHATAAAEEQGLSALASSFGVALGAPTAAGAGEVGASAGPHGAAVAGSAGTAKASSTNLVESLLAQISSLQGELQGKREALSSTKSTLQGRLSAAESALAAAEADARRAEAAAQESTQAASALRSELYVLRGTKARSDAECGILADKLRDAEERLANVSAAQDALQRQVGELRASNADLRGRWEDAQGARAAANHMATVLREQLAACQEELDAYKKDVQSLRRELGAYREAAHASGNAAVGVRAGLRPFAGSVDAAADAGSAFLLDAVSAGPQADGASPNQSPAKPMRAPAPIIRATIDALEQEKEQLCARVATLSSHVAELEAAGQRAQHLEADLAALKAKSDLLLDILGEREEELDQLREELADVKDSYKVSLEHLMRQVVEQDKVVAGDKTPAQ